MIWCDACAVHGAALKASAQGLIVRDQFNVGSSTAHMTCALGRARAAAPRRPRSPQKARPRPAYPAPARPRADPTAPQ